MSDLQNSPNGQNHPQKLIFGINDKVSSLPLWILLGIQNFLTSFGSMVGIPRLMVPYLCMDSGSLTANLMSAKMLQTSFFCSGICTLLQCSFGTRLPIVQGANVAMFTAICSVLLASGPITGGSCPKPINETAEVKTFVYPWDKNLVSSENDGSLETIFFTEQDLINHQMQYVQGVIIIGGLIETLIGISGAVGIFMQYISKMTIAVAISLLALSLFKLSTFTAYWPITGLLIFLVVSFSNLIQDVEVPLPYLKNGEIAYKKMQIFKMFPVFLAIVIGWGICLILNYAGILDNATGNQIYAKASSSSDLISASPWFDIPMPFNWVSEGTKNSGMTYINLTFTATMGMISGVLASIIESLGDYIACAQICQVPKPPKHAINRGIMFEGIGTIIGGIFGTGNGMTSYSENIGTICITKCASNYIVKMEGILLIIIGCLAKFSSLIICMPGAVISGIYCTMFGMITGVGLENLSAVDLKNSRNTMILGLSIFMGMAIPEWLNSGENSQSIMNLFKGTSFAGLSSVIFVLMNNSMFVGGIISCILDNLIQGSSEKKVEAETELYNLPEQVGLLTSDAEDDPYEFPVKVSKNFKNLPIFS